MTAESLEMSDEPIFQGAGSLIPQLTIVAGRHATSRASFGIVMASSKGERLHLENVASDV